MNKDFLRCVEENKIAEQIAYEVLSLATFKPDLDYKVHDVSNIKECQHKGDIFFRNKKDNSFSYVEVKNDSRIAGRPDSTGNILCEEQVYYEESGEWKDGFMRYCEDYLAVVSRQAKRIFIIDLSVLKQHYKQGKHIKKMKKNNWQHSEVYLYPLRCARKNGALLYEIDYDEWGNEDFHFPREIRKVN